MLRFLLVLFVLSVQCFAAITIETVPVGDPGNAADTEVMSDGTTGYGSVEYEYLMGRYEITAGQYTAFLNAVARTDTYFLYTPSMWSSSYGCKIQRSGSPGSYAYAVSSNWADRPVNYVSFWSACRFANWLHNGQPVGPQGASTTEYGAYTLNGYTGHDGRLIQRNPDARWFLPSEDEWYKAAYYTGGGTNAGYWNYPTQSDTAPANQVLTVDPGNSANYYSLITGYAIGSPYYRTIVGEFENSASAYGTFDQGGNLWEWNASIYYLSEGYAARRLRGGSYDYSVNDVLLPTGRTYMNPNETWAAAGFRVANAVAEPSSLTILAGGVGIILGIRRRRGL